MLERMDDGIDWDDLDPATQQYLDERAHALHNGDMIKCVVRILIEARERHDRHLATGGEGFADPDDPWDQLNAAKVDHFLAKDAARDARRREP